MITASHDCCPVHGPGALSPFQGLAQARALRVALAREDTDAEVVPQEALEFFRGKGLQPGFSHLDVWREEHAYAFTVAREMRLDILSDIRDSIDDALREGTPFQAWRKDLQPWLEANGWDGDSRHRLKTIFLTNMRVARGAGHWHRVQRTKADRPYLMYRIGPSNNHRPHHVAWDGTILPVDDPFWQTHYPPNGWGCKCYVRQLSAAAAEARGGVSARPDMSLVEHEIRGETVLAPAGIDPGWDFNPGALRAPPPVAGGGLPQPPSPAPAQPPAPKFTAIPTDPERLAEFLGDEHSLLHVSHQIEPGADGWKLTPKVAKQMALEHRARWKPGNEKATKVLFARMDASLRSVTRRDRNAPRMRGLLRRFVAGALPEVASRDMLRASSTPMLPAGELPRARYDRYLHGARMPSRGALAYHTGRGEVAMSPIVSQLTIMDVTKLAAGEKIGVSHGLSSAVHEELHGYSPAYGRAYRTRVGQAVEEATTEILARRVMRTLHGSARSSTEYGTKYKGAYQKTIDALLLNVRDHLALAEKPARLVDALSLVEEAALDMRRPGRPPMVTGEQHARVLVDKIAEIAELDTATTEQMRAIVLQDMQKGAR